MTNQNTRKLAPQLDILWYLGLFWCYWLIKSPKPNKVCPNFCYPVYSIFFAAGRQKLTATVGLVVHSAVDGIALGSASMVDKSDIQLIVFVAIMLHKAPAAFGLTTILLMEGLEKSKIKKHLFVFSSAAPIGALVTYFLMPKVCSISWVSVYCIFFRTQLTLLQPRHQLVSCYYFLRVHFFTSQPYTYYPNSQPRGPKDTCLSPRVHPRHLHIPLRGQTSLVENCWCWFWDPFYRQFWHRDIIIKAYFCELLIRGQILRLLLNRFLLYIFFTRFKQIN